MDAFRFDEHFQQNYIAFFLRDTVFFQHVKGDVQPELFTSDMAQRAAMLILGWAEQNESPPGALIFSEIKLLEEKVELDPREIEPLKKYLKMVLDIPLQNRGFLIAQHDRFVAHQKLIDAWPKFKEVMRVGDHDTARKMMNDLVTQTGSFAKIGGFVEADASVRVARRQQEDEEKFWLLMPEVDRAVDGLRRKKIGVWQSQRSSAGKTAALIHSIKAFLLQGKQVLVFTLEDSKDDYEDKLDQCVAGLRLSELQEGQKIEAAFRRTMRRGGRVHIAEMPPGATKVSDMRRYHTFLQNTKNWYPDVVLVDYADLCAPEDPRLLGDTFATGHNVYLNLARWATEENVALWTAAQSGRGAITDEQADQQHMGLSLAKIWNSHLVLSINRTAEEQEQGLTQIYVVKNKNGPARFSKTIHSDFDRMHFYCIPKDD